MTAKKAPCVDIETDALKDERYEVVAELAGLANKYEAIGRHFAIKAWCTDRGLQDAPDDCDVYVVSEAVVRRFLGATGTTAILADGCDEFAFAERRADGRLALRGTEGIVAAKRRQLASAAAGGEARSRGQRDGTGRFVVDDTNVQPSLQPEPADSPPEQPAANQPNPASSSSSSSSLPGSQNSHAPRAIPFVATSWKRRMEWWQCMLDAHDRLRKPTKKRPAIKPGTPDLAKHPNERALIECERFLREAGYDEDGVDAKMRHVPLVYETEAEALGHLDFFKPAIIWDTTRADRFPRKVDTSLEEAARAGPKSRASPKRAGELIGSAPPRDDHPDNRQLIPISEL